MKVCGECDLYHNGCEFTEIETTENSINNYVACELC